MRRRTLILVALAGAAAIAATWLFLARNASLFEPPDEEQRIIVQAANEYGTMEMLPLTRVVAQRELSALVRDTPMTGPLAQDDPRAAELAELVSTFVDKRFVCGSAAEYRAWREGQGYAWAERKWLEDVWGIGRDYGVVVGGEYPEGAPLGEIFDAYYDAALKYGNGANRPVAVAADRQGRCIATSILTRDQPDRAPLTCDLGVDLWHGGSNGTARSWWKPPGTMTELIQRDGSVLCADVGLVMEFEDKTRRPVVLTATWDTAVSRWTLQHLCTYNFSAEQMERLSAFDY